MVEVLNLRPVVSHATDSRQPGQARNGAASRGTVRVSWFRMIGRWFTASAKPIGGKGRR